MFFLFSQNCAGADKAACLFFDGENNGQALFEHVFKEMKIKRIAADEFIGEGRFTLKGSKVLIIGPRAMNDARLSRWVRRSGEEIRDFVGKGGTVLVFAQEPAFWDVEPWFPEQAFLLRDGKAPGKPVSIMEDHPLFRLPHILESDSLCQNLPPFAGAGGAIREIENFLVLAKNETGAPWAVETGWGDGRVVVLAWGPGKIDEEEIESKKPARPLLFSRSLVENAVLYAFEAARGEGFGLPEGIPIEKWGKEARLTAERFTARVDKALAARINASVDKGIAYLKRAQLEDGAWGTYGASNGPYEAGLTAIALLALLDAGVNKHQDCIKRGFGWLLENPPKRTYEIALSMMALDVKAAPLFERFELARLTPEERRKRGFRRDLTEREKRFMEACRDKILAHHRMGGTWYYCDGIGEGDISNGQYAVLGLKAAARCGVKVKREIWEEILDYFLTFQASGGPKVTLPRFRGFDRDGTPKFYSEKAEARGWQYRFGHPGEVQGSLVCIGIACTLLCYEEVKGHRGKVRKSVRDGLAWLYSHWAVDSIPCAGKSYYYYYIYSLERVGVLIDCRFIGDRDWYREGAEYLMTKQEPDGGWACQANEWGSPISNTAFALLFLKRSTPPPVITVGQ